ncbi:hypothetical protein CNY89_27855, partial [Amaricoccus sp. HAR-UPW-R2A-40]
PPRHRSGCGGRCSPRNAAAAADRPPRRSPRPPRLGQPVGLVRADRQPPAGGRDLVQRRLHPVIGPGVAVDVLRVMQQQPRIGRLDDPLVRR